MQLDMRKKRKEKTRNQIPIDVSCIFILYREVFLKCQCSKISRLKSQHFETSERSVYVNIFDNFSYYTQTLAEILISILFKPLSYTNNIESLCSLYL